MPHTSVVGSVRTTELTIPTQRTSCGLSLSKGPRPAGCTPPASHSVRLLAKLELDLLAGELLVHGRKGVDLVLDVGRLLGVEVDLADLRAVEAVARVLAHNLGRVDQVLQDRLVHRRQRSAHRPLLLRLALARRRLPHDAPLADQDDVLAREL